MSGLVPERALLLGKETSDAFHRLLAHIRDADTDRELLLYMEQMYSASREYRDLFSMLEREALKKMREFRDGQQPGGTT